MCPSWKVKNASSVLRHFALSWWESLDPLDKPQSWDYMKRLMRVTFVNAPPSLNSYDEVNHLEEESVVISLAMPFCRIMYISKRMTWKIIKSSQPCVQIQNYHITMHLLLLLIMMT